MNESINSSSSSADGNNNDVFSKPDTPVNTTLPTNINDINDHSPIPSFILPSIVLCQFAGTSLWFAGNAVLSDMVEDYDLDADSSLGYLTSAVQLGFIFGTLILALTNLADRYSPTKLFGIMALIGAATNACIPWLADAVFSSNGQSSPDAVLGVVIALRLFTGCALAGIYPVGMKVASDWYATGLGWALGLLVGALAFGSAFPFLLNQASQPWQWLLWETSVLAVGGGLWMAFVVPNGPHRKAASKLDFRVIYTLFEGQSFRSAAFGYFGHMWELYAFWTWSPVVIEAYLADNEDAGWDPSFVAFMVLAMGSVGCIVGGFLSQKYGSAAVAVGSLVISGLACLLSPAVFHAPPIVFLIFYLIWGLAVVSDSPQFSSLVAQTAPAENKGTALTIVNCIGFAITIGSIQLLGGVPVAEKYLFLLLSPGPLFGIWSMRSYYYGIEEDVAVEDGEREHAIE